MAGLGPLALMSMAVVLAACSSLLPADPTECAFLGRRGDFPAHSVTRASCAEALVLNDGRSLTVYLARVPHLDGETLHWLPDGGDWVRMDPGVSVSSTGTFYSPAHGERFDLAGAVLEPPANRPLWRCPTEVRGTQLWITAPTGSSAEQLVTICQSGS